MTDTDAQLKLIREIERAISDFGMTHKPGLATLIATRLLRDMPAILEAVKGSAKGRVS